MHSTRDRRVRFNRDALPSPHAYLSSEGLLSSRTRAEWASVRCPVHKQGEEQKPSMVVSLLDGHFKCMACGAKGGDILALHRLRTGASFMDAARDLGALR